MAPLGLARKQDGTIVKVFKGFVAGLTLAVLGFGPALGQGSIPAGGQAQVPALAPFSPSPAAAGVFTSSPATPAVTAAPVVPAQAASAAAKPAAATAGSLRRAYNSVNVDERYVALTFDDGPNPETTIKLLDTLKARGVKATFFVLGSRAAQHPAIVRRMVAEGHEVANHSWNHPQLPKIPRAAAEKQIEDTQAAVAQATGQRPIYIRPPYGAMTPALRSHLEQKYGLTFIYWSVDPLDWKNRNANTVREKVLAQVHPGAIILLHDIHPTTVAAVPQMLDTLIARGYKFATTSEIIAMDRPGAPRVAAAAPAAPRPAKTQRKPQPSHRHTPTSGSMGLY